MSLGFPIIRTTLVLRILKSQFVSRHRDVAEVLLGRSYDSTVRYFQNVLDLHSTMVANQTRLTKLGIQTIDLSRDAVDQAQRYIFHLNELPQFTERSLTFFAMAIASGEIRMRVHGMLLDNMRHIDVEKGAVLLADGLHLVHSQRVGFYYAGKPQSVFRSIIEAQDRQDALRRLNGLITSGKAGVYLDRIGRPVFRETRDALGALINYCTPHEARPRIESDYYHTLSTWMRRDYPITARLSYFLLSIG